MVIFNAMAWESFPSYVKRIYRLSQPTYGEPQGPWEDFESLDIPNPFEFWLLSFAFAVAS